MQRLPESYLERGIVLLNQRISRLLSRSGIFVADSTGITCDRGKKRVIRALRVVEVEEHVKLHVIAELRPGIASIASARVTEGEAHDASVAEEILSRDELGEGILLANSAYDSEQIFKACFERDSIPVIKARKNSKKGRFSRQARECFSREGYLFRGVAEGVFGAIELKYINPPHTFKQNQS